MKTGKPAIILISALIASACTWVDLKPEAEKVRIASMDDLKGCHKMGSSTVSVKAEIATFARNKEKVRGELETLARNNAIDIGGNVVVPVSEIDRGTQSFVIYRCPRQ